MTRTAIALILSVRKLHEVMDAWLPIEMHLTASGTWVAVVTSDRPRPFVWYK